MPMSDFPRANVGFSALRAKTSNNDPIFTRKSDISGRNLSVFFSFPGQIFFFRLFVKRSGSFQREARSMSDFEVETTAFNEEPKRVVRGFIAGRVN